MAVDLGYWSWDSLVDTTQAWKSLVRTPKIIPTVVVNVWQSLSTKTCTRVRTPACAVSPTHTKVHGPPSLLLARANVAILNGCVQCGVGQMRSRFDPTKRKQNLKIHRWQYNENFNNYHLTQQPNCVIHFTATRDKWKFNLMSSCVRKWISKSMKLPDSFSHKNIQKRKVNFTPKNNKWIFSIYK
jgi:hypothetical protein